MNPTGQAGAVELLAAMLAMLSSKYEEVGVDEMTGAGATVCATVHLPSGDRYRATVEWLGDREGTAA